MGGIETGRSTIGLALIASAFVTAGVIFGCSETSKPGPDVIQRIEGQSTVVPAATGFLGSDYSLLKPGLADQAALVYINPNVQWSQYDKIMLEPVEFWDGENSSISPEDQHMLTSYFYNQLKTDLQKNFTLVDQGGPGVMVLQVALINAKAATPVMRSVSLVVPQIRLANALQSMATGSYAFVGSAEAAGKVTDSQSGQLLAAAIDQREGGTSIKAAAQWQWGDAESAMNLWAEKTSARLASFRSGTAAPAAAAPAAASSPQS
jgi:Protein of unknown function (DUF3313)